MSSFCLSSRPTPSAPDQDTQTPMPLAPIQPAAPLSAAANPAPANDAAELRFGRYRVIPGARQVLADGQPVKLGSRAFDLLVVLLRAQGQIVAREDIIRQVWPSTTVDETNLRFQMGVLRRALGKERDVITTIPGRGYLLAVDIADPAPPLPSALQPTPLLPEMSPGNEA